MKSGFSMRFNLWTVIGAMGLLGMALAMATGYTYRDLTLERQRGALLEMIQYKTKDLFGNLESTSFKLGIDMQHEAGFRAAFTARDQDVLEQFLDTEFHRYFGTAGVVKLEKLYVFDANFQLLSESTDPAGLPVTIGKPLCNDLVERAGQRQGAERLKPISALCLHNGMPHYAVLAPVGGLRANGYIQVIADPAYSLLRLESELGMPLKLQSAGGKTLYQSPKWPANAEMSQHLTADFAIKAGSNGTAMVASMASDMTSLYQDLARARNMMLLIAGAATLLTGFLALLIMQKSTLRPLNSLIAQIRRVLHDRNSLGEQVSISGTAEIRELAASFNTMTVELKDLYDTMEKLAFSDALTGLPNRTLFNDRVHQLILISQRQNSPFAMLMMDLNRFKQVNDTLGHAVGDELLQQVAQRLLAAVRQSDTLTRLKEDSTLARLGGDEFAAILPMVTSIENTAVVAMRLRDAMEMPFDIAGKHFTVGISIGIAMFPTDGADAITLMRHADMAMYEAKRSQKGLCFYNSADDEATIFELTFEADLRSALEQGELEPYFQPKVAVSSGAVCGAEALLRWQHPRKGFIAPDAFIPLAEQTGLIQPLTEWVIDKALEQCALWHRGGFPLPVSVNLSTHSLVNRQIIDDVAHALQKWNVAPSSLCLELTESAVMSEPERALDILRELDAMGVSLSIDDFGTGYSSLSYLKQLPVDELKIDKSFVIGMDKGNDDSVIVRSTIELAHNLHLSVVAEGVETQQMRDQLASLGCDVLQGYLFSRPIPAIEFFRHLSEGKWHIHVPGQPRAAGGARMHYAQPAADL